MFSFSAWLASGRQHRSFGTHRCGTAHGRRRSTTLVVEVLETRDVPSTMVTETLGGIQYLAIVEPDGGGDGLGAIVRMNPATGTTTLLSDNAIAKAGVFNHPTALTLETINGVGYLTFLDPTGGPDGEGSIVRVNPTNGSVQVVSDNAISHNGSLFHDPSDLITEITSSGAQYLTFVDATGGSDALGSIVRINPSNGGSQLVSDNAISRNSLFNKPSALTLETINGIGYLTFLDPTGGGDALGSIVRVNPSTGAVQLVSDDAVAGRDVFLTPADLITETNSSGTQYLALLDTDGGSDNLGQIVRINPTNGAAQTVSDNAVAGRTVFDNPTTLTLETISGVGYLTFMDPTSTASEPGPVERINPTSGAAQTL